MDPLPRAADLPLDQQVLLLSGGGFWHTQRLADAGVPAAVLSDGPHGLRVVRGERDALDLSRSEPATCFPTAVTLASSWDETLVGDVYRALGVEARALGVDVVLGPGLNIKRHPCGGRSFEYFSEDPLLTGRLAAAAVRGLQDTGVGACPKHFAVNNQESHRFVVDAVVDERTLREVYLAAFEHVVREAGPWTVMAAYNSVNGEPATANRRLLAEVLRGEWGFDGLVMSDWGAVGDRVAALEAGLDLEMPGSRGLFDGEVLTAVRDGRLSPDVVATSAQRVLDLVGRAPRRPEGSVPVEEHHDLARRAATAGTVLLANDGVLPLASDVGVALVGAFAEHPRFQGGGSSHVNPTRTTSALGELRGRGVEVTYAPGYDARTADRDARLVDEAVAAARAADVAVVLVGLPERWESEGFDRADLSLPAQHDDLVTAVAAANPRTVVVLANGAPVVMPWIRDVAAVVECYLGGQAGAAALVDVLLGDAEPGGRLAETFPARRQDVAADPFFPGRPRQVEHREGLLVGYRHHVTSGAVPLFPFGHGLGYTTFSWGGATLSSATLRAGDELVVTVPVTNTGTRAGGEVVQVYLHDRTGAVARPRRWLAGYARVRLAAGESAAAEVVVAGRAFAFFDVAAGAWRTPGGPFEVEVARSSADVVEVLPVEVVGDLGELAPADGTAGPAAVAASDADFARLLGRPVPVARAARPFTRDSTLDELATTRLGAALRALLWRAGPGRAAGDDVQSAMVERSFGELPLRAVAIFAQGRLPWSVVDGLLLVLDGRPAAAAATAARRLLAAARLRARRSGPVGRR